jgi:hypothetical protein
LEEHNGLYADIGYTREAAGKTRNGQHSHNEQCAIANPFPHLTHILIVI